MTPHILEWGQRVVTAADVAGQDVLEVGSRDVNGSLRGHIESLGPRSYTGIDIAEGHGVDEVLGAEVLLDRFGRDRYGLVVSTEMLEHTEDWQVAVWNMMAVTSPGGLMIVTTVSPGYPHHEWPGDHWRYTRRDFRRIWRGWAIEDLYRPSYEGVFLRARKPASWQMIAARDHLQTLSVMAAP